MAPRTVSVKDFYNLFPKNKMMDSLPLIKVELIVEIDFDTFGQVQYSDENGRPWIKEFAGNRWTKEIFLKEPKEIVLNVFINNQFLQKNKNLYLIKKIDEQIVAQKEFVLSGDKLFEGWFKL